MQRNFWTGVLLVLILAAGCQTKAPPPDPKTRFRGIVVKVLIPESELMRALLDDQRGEWAAETGGQIEIETMSLEDVVAPHGSIPGSALAEQSDVTGDILIFPSTELGNVAASGYAAKIPKEVLTAPDLELVDIARGVQEQLVTWDRQVYGIPISAECMLLYYRLDLFADPERRQAFMEKYGRPLEPPHTWNQFDQLAEYFTGQDLDGDSVPDRAVAISSPGDALICRAAALGKAPQNFSFFFDVNSFEPMVTKPAFQQAMRQWVELLPLVVTPANDPTLAKFTAGQAAMAIGSSRLAEQWLRSGTTNGSPRIVAAQVACVPLPGSTRVYQHDKLSWADLPPDKSNRAAVINGLVGTVPKNSLDADAAFDFLIFLSNRQHSLPYVTTSAYGLGPYRLSHVVDTATWASSGWTTAGGTASFLSALRESLNNPNVVTSLRIDASKRYHEALDQSASEVFHAGKSTEQALNELAERWREISDERGHDRQRRNYRYALGMPVLN